MSESPRTTFGKMRTAVSARLPADRQSILTIEMLNFILILYLVIYTLVVLAVFIFIRNVDNTLLTTLRKGGPVVFMLLVTQGIVRLGYVRAGAMFLVFTLWVNSFYQAFTSGGVASPEFAAYMLVIVIAGLFLGLRGAMVTGGTSVAAGVVLYVLETQGRLPPVAAQGAPAEFFAGLMRLILVAGLLYLFLRRLNQILASLQTANTELEKSGQELEQRVADRTRALTLSTEISRRLSTILDQEQLTREVVNQLQQAFNYYHVHIYLFDDARQSLLMVSGTGEAGQVMLARRHRIIAGRGLIGRAAETNRPVLVSDTSQDSGWLPNPLLPETRCELAVPIAFGEQVLGVLDVQQTSIAGLTQADVDLIQLVASQMATALQNAWTYSKSQQRADREALVVALNQKIQQAATIEDVLKVAVSGLGQGLGAQRSSVELRSKAAGEKS